jgi:hypothetical protein
MIEFYQGESIPLILPLVEYTTGAAIDTDDLSGATVLVQDPDGSTLKQGTLTAGTVTRSGQYLKFFVENTLTESATTGVYKVFVVTTKSDSRFSNAINIASYVGKMFRLRSWSGP